MKLQTIIISLLIFGAIITGTWSFANNIASQYGTPVPGSYIEPFNKTQELSIEIEQKYARVQNLSANSGSAFNIITLIPDILSIVKDIVVLPYTVISGLITAFANVLYLPPWLVGFLVAIVGAVLLFAIINAVLRWDT